MAQGRGGIPGAIRMHSGPIAQHDSPGTPSDQVYHSDGDFDPPLGTGSYLRLT